MIADRPDRRGIEEFAKSHGFGSQANSEKFLMDFYVYSLLAGKIDFCVRGGLCTPFYTKEAGANRLSVDLDGFSVKSRDYLIENVPKILNSHKIKCTPRKPREIRNLLQFDLKYTTPLGQHDEKSHVRIDVMHDANIEFPHHTIHKGHKLFFGETSNDVVALTRGCLVADKVSSLAIGKGGYISAAKTPKQIHDIGYILNDMTAKDALEAISTFSEINDFKLAHRTTDITTDDTISSVEKFVGGLLEINDIISMQKSYVGHFEEFKKSYLSNKATYTPNDLKANILKVWAYSTILKRTVRGDMRPQHASEMLYKILSKHCDYAKNTDGQDGREGIMSKLSGHFPHKNFSGESTENLYLLLEIIGIDD